MVTPDLEDMDPRDRPVEVQALIRAAALLYGVYAELDMAASSILVPEVDTTNLERGEWHELAGAAWVLLKRVRALGTAQIEALERAEAWERAPWHPQAIEKRLDRLEAFYAEHPDAVGSERADPDAERNPEADAAEARVTEGDRWEMAQEQHRLSDAEIDAIAEQARDEQQRRYEAQAFATPQYPQMLVGEVSDDFGETWRPMTQAEREAAWADYYRDHPEDVPSEKQLNDWNIHNDHAAGGDVEDGSDEEWSALGFDTVRFDE